MGKYEDMIGLDLDGFNDYTETNIYAYRIRKIFFDIQSWANHIQSISFYIDEVRYVDGSWDIEILTFVFKDNIDNSGDW